MKGAFISHKHFYMSTLLKYVISALIMDFV